MWYIFMCALKDEETQRKGVVILAEKYGSRSHRSEKLRDLQRIRAVQVGIPTRWLGAHLCFSNPVLWPIVTGLKLFAITFNHSRFRTHFGNPNDIAFELQTFGFPPDCCPSEDPDVTWHHEWLLIQQTQEENKSTVSAVVIPRRFDVLFGKSKRAREHPGTIRCQYLVEMMRDRYEQASRQEKTIVADQIIAAIRESQGRFLKCEKGLWVEVEHSIGREKISHWFRHMRSKTGSPSEQERQGATGKRPSVAKSSGSSKRPGLSLEAPSLLSLETPSVLSLGSPSILDLETPALVGSSATASPGRPI